MKRPHLLQKSKWIIYLLINWLLSLISGLIVQKITNNPLLAVASVLLLGGILSLTVYGNYTQSRRLGQILKENRALNKRTLLASARVISEVRNTNNGGVVTGKSRNSTTVRSDVAAFNRAAQQGDHASTALPPSLSPIETLQETKREIEIKAKVHARKISPIVGELATEWITSRQSSVEFKDSSNSFPYRTNSFPFSHEIPVAMIADDFTYNSFVGEFECHRLMPNNWRTVMDTVRPKMFFCESAWQGGSPAEHPWQGKIYASVRWPKENRSILLSILEYCNINGIPTVFWNKEDPVHFSDRINDFIRTAALFDFVFTTAEECIDSYRRDVGVKNVDVLPFAVQPKLFNPLGSSSAADSASFAGTWYARYPERCKSAEEIMDLVLAEGKTLSINNRMFSNSSPAYAYPERFRQFTKPAISYQETATAYKESRFGITLNTVTDSKTMFARRVFELAASGSVVLSNYSIGVDNFFGDSVIFADRDPSRLRELDENGYRELQRDALEISLQHTYRHRAEKILSSVGIVFNSAFQLPTAVVRVSSAEEAKDAKIFFSDNQDVYTNLLIVVAADAAQTLVMDIMRTPTPKVTIISQRELDRHDYRSRNLIETPGAVIVNRNNPLSAKDVHYLASHASYTSEPIAMAHDTDKRFTLATGHSMENAFVRADKLIESIESSVPAKTVYLV